MIEKVQMLLLKMMGRTGDAQKLNQVENLYTSPGEWKIIKSRFDESYCFYARTGSATIHRYCKNLRQETIRKTKAQREIILIENKDMFDQLIRAFGTCVCSTVRKIFLPSGTIPLTDGIGKGSQGVKSSDVLNTLIVLDDVRTRNEDVQYNYWSSNRGVTFIYNVEKRLLSVRARYKDLKADQEQVAQYYTNLVSIDAVDRSEDDMIPVGPINELFEAYECVFVVQEVRGNSTFCRVTERDINANYLYQLNSVHTFNLEFVLSKINEDLS